MDEYTFRCFDREFTVRRLAAGGGWGEGANITAGAEDFEHVSAACLEILRLAERAEDRDAATLTAEEGSEIIGELSAALAVLAGESLKPCQPPCGGHLGEKALEAYHAALAAWRALQEGNAKAAARIQELEGDDGDSQAHHRLIEQLADTLGLGGAVVEPYGPYVLGAVKGVVQMVGTLSMRIAELEREVEHERAETSRLTASPVNPVSALRRAGHRLAELEEENRALRERLDSLTGDDADWQQVAEARAFRQAVEQQRDDMIPVLKHRIATLERDLEAMNERERLEREAKIRAEEWAREVEAALRALVVEPGGLGAWADMDVEHQAADHRARLQRTEAERAQGARKTSLAAVSIALEAERRRTAPALERLARLDALLASGEPPEGLKVLLAGLNCTASHAGATAWRWFRDALGDGEGARAEGAAVVARDPADQSLADLLGKILNSIPWSAAEEDRIADFIRAAPRLARGLAQEVGEDPAERCAAPFLPAERRVPFLRGGAWHRDWPVEWLSEDEIRRRYPPMRGSQRGARRDEPAEVWPERRVPAAPPTSLTNAACAVAVTEAERALKLEADNRALRAQVDAVAAFLAGEPPAPFRRLVGELADSRRTWEWLRETLGGGESVARKE